MKSVKTFEKARISKRASTVQAGIIELRRLREAVEAAGYQGPIEVEIFNEEVWRNAGLATLEQICERYRQHVL